MTKRIDFTNCKQIPGRAYSGANGKKISVEYDGKRYMLKFPPSGAKKPTALSYINSCVSEHIASSIFNILGVMAQETMLGTFDIGDKTKVVCACLDFTAGGKILYDYCSIKNTVLDSDSSGAGTELDDVIETIENQGDSVEQNKEKAFFWHMESAKRGSIYSMKSVYDFYSSGEVVAKDRKLASYWYEKYQKAKQEEGKT